MSKVICTLFLISAFFICYIRRSEALTCLSCDKGKDCLKEPTNCPYGFGKDICNCCTVCAKGPGEDCGGIWNMYGSCGTGWTCYPLNRYSDHPGKCISKAPKFPIETF